MIGALLSFLLLFAVLATHCMRILAIRGMPTAAVGLGFVFLFLSAPVFFVIGGFAGRFNDGICYSSSMYMIANAVEQTHSPVQLAEQIRALPMHGYETDCAEVEFAAAELPNAVVP
jgi:hypothetical protein